MPKKRVALAAVFLTLGLVCAGYWIRPGLPPLRDGDLVFQTSSDPQSLAILAASASLYSHAGIVEKTPEGDKVIEAARVVRENPLKRWISQGVFGRIAVYRYRGLAAEQAGRIVEAARRYDGTPYDIYFSFRSKNMYCSKLPYLAYRDAGVPLGELQTFSELHMDNMLVRNLIEKRRQSFPDCANKDFAQCYDYLMHQPVITPARVAADAHLEEIYSNYSPF